MPRFAANLSFLYAELPFLKRFEAAAQDGFEAVEYMSPYEWEASDITAQLRAHGLQQVLFNTPAGGMDRAEMARAWEAGERGRACQPGQEAEFRCGIEMALGYAQRLDCPRIHILAGLVPPAYRSPASSHEALDTHGPLARVNGPLRDTFMVNLRWAARRAAEQGCEVLIEPINTRDIAHYFLNRQADAHAIVSEVGEPNLKVQMDLYHCQVVEGDVAAKVRAYLPTGQVGHFQIAGAPQRQEPDAGEQNYGYLLEVIDEVSRACGWQGWVGCEYRPALGEQPGATHAGLAWLRRWRAQHPLAT
jgi:2-dehydrotetronate isomerase